MVSPTAVTKCRRRIKKAKQGAPRKKQLAKWGSTPKLLVIVDSAADVPPPSPSK